MVLFISLNMESKLLFLSWTVIGLIFYFLYGYRQAMSGAAIDVSDPAMTPEVARLAPMPGAGTADEGRGSLPPFLCPTRIAVVSAS